MPDLAATPFNDLLTAIAAKTPTPGGGAVSAMTGALAAAVAGMVVAYSAGRRSLAAHEPVLREAGATLATSRATFLRLADEDAVAYAPLNDLLRMPADDARRVRDLPAAVQAALLPPRCMLAAALHLLGLCERLAPITNRHLRSDLAVAAVLAEGAARSAAWNVEVNIPLLDDESARGRLADECRREVAGAREACARVEAACAAG
jgi:methenyltetrahydrofolate cyclohydrolase